MKNTKKLFALVLALALVFTAFAGCAGGTGSSTGGSASGDAGTGDGEGLPALDTSKEVELVMYFISDRPAKYDEIEANFNEIFKEKLNCTLKTEVDRVVRLREQVSAAVLLGRKVRPCLHGDVARLLELCGKGRLYEPRRAFGRPTRRTTMRCSLKPA